MNPCISKNPSLNTIFHLRCYGFHEDAPYAGISRIVKESAESKSTNEDISRAVAKEVDDIAVSHFSNHMYEISKCLNASFEKKRILPLYYAMNAFLAFTFFIDTQIKKYTLHCPDDQNFAKECDAVYEEIAALRYEKNPKAVQKIGEFLDCLKNKLKEFGQWDELQDGLEWEAWEKIFSYNGLFEVDLAVLVGANKQDPKKHVCFTTLNISVEHLCKTYYLLAQSVFDRSRYLLNKYVQIFKSFENCPQYPGLLYSRRVVEELSTLIFDKLLPKTLVTDQIEMILNNKHLLVEIDKKIETLEGLKKESEKKFLLPDNSGLIPIYTEKIERLKALHKQLGRSDTVSYKPLSIMRIAFDHEVVDKAELNQEFTLSDFNKVIEFQNEVYKAHMQIDSYFADPLTHMIRIAEALDVWHSAHEKMGRVSGILKILSSKEDDHFVEEEWMKSPSPKKTKKKEKPQKAFLPAVEKKIQNETVLEPPGLSSASVASHEPTAFETASILKRTLQEMISQEEKKRGFPKVALRQSEMYLSDLLVNYQRLQKDYSESTVCELFFGMEMAAYYFMEQFIRYQRLISQKSFDPEVSFCEHNLKQAFHQLSLKSKINPKAINQHYMGYLWVQSTYEQFTQWTQLREQWGVSIPQSLLLLVQSFDKHSKSAMAIYQKSLTECFQGTVEFAKSFHQIDAKHHFSCLTENERFSLRLENKDLVLKVKELHYAIAKIEKKYQNPKLMQLKRDLSLIEKRLFRLCNPSPEEFSLIVRQQSFLQGSVLELLMQILMEIQTKKTSTEHRITLLVETIRWYKTLPEKEKKFLTTYFDQVHNISRYPFDGEPKTMWHHLILQAEFLREHPELLQGFNLSEEKWITTPLNFVPLPNQEFKIEHLIEKMVFSFDRVLEISLNWLIPEITTAIKTEV